MTRAARAVIDLGALAHNLQQARAAAPQQQVLAVIKADGYGHGIVAVTKALVDADGFGVACLDEALQLREAGIRKPILLLEGFFHADELAIIGEHGLHIVVHHESQLRAIEEAARRDWPYAPLTTWLKVDTGMHRLGFDVEAVPAAWLRLCACPLIVQSPKLMTHLANADDLDDGITRKQLQTFANLLPDMKTQRSVANSAGLLGWPATLGEVVRPGIMLYGASPFLGETGEQRDLRPVMTLTTELFAIKQCKRGDAVGYGGAWVCPEDMLIGVAAIGYGDGYPRHASPGTPVLVNGRRAPLVGRVSMDMITVDLRGLPQAKIGDPVVLWGEGLPAEEVAVSAATISYELFCGVTARVRREYING
jgi:alanine racemase